MEHWIEHASEIINENKEASFVPSSLVRKASTIANIYELSQIQLYNQAIIINGNLTKERDCMVKEIPELS